MLVVCGLSALPARGSDAAPTFTHDVAPILFAHCAACHRPGDAGPFPLLTHADAAPHAKQIAKVTTHRVMPPWLPEGQPGHFANERRLTDAEIDTLRRWADAGAPEGNPADLPAAPAFPDGWRLGKPDLVVELPTPYTLPADGKDVYRNFVLPTGLTTTRYVRAVEMRPGNPKVAHHAFLLLDAAGLAHRRDGADGQGPGYPGMSAGDDVGNPGGQFLAWQPGKQPVASPPGSPWKLDAGQDLVLQLHLRPSGKPESIRPAVALYFTDQPPTVPLLTLLLRKTSIDIPAGQSDYAIESQYTLPVDIDVLNITPHAHYLGADLRGDATLPDGSTVPLIHIPHWDFNWQGDYPLAQPLRLPRGTTVRMRFTYDNSAANPANPSHPPKPVHYGPNSTDEMGELWLQVRAANVQDFPTLARDYVTRYATPDAIERLQNVLRFDPGDAAHQATTHADLATFLLNTGRSKEGMLELQQSLQLDPNCAHGHRLFATVLANRANWTAAAEQFRKAAAADPDDYRSRADLGLSLANVGDLAGAQEQLTESLKLHEKDPITHANLARVLAARGDPAGALTEIDRATALDPENPFVKQVSAALRPAPAPAAQQAPAAGRPPNQ